MGMERKRERERGRWRTELRKVDRYGGTLNLPRHPQGCCLDQSRLKVFARFCACECARFGCLGNASCK